MMLNIAAVTIGGTEPQDIGAGIGIGLVGVIAIYYCGKFAIECCQNCFRFHRVRVYPTREIEIDDQELTRRATVIMISALENVQREYARAPTLPPLPHTVKATAPPIPPRPAPPGMDKKQKI